MNNMIKKFTYGGLFIGSIFGWYLPSLINWNISYFSKSGLSIVFGILGVILGYKLFKYLNKKF